MSQTPPKATSDGVRKFSLGKLITEYIASIVPIALGAFLLLRNHPMAGGWTLAIGIVGFCFSSGDTRK